MSQQVIEKLRTELTANRAKKLETKLAELFAEMEQERLTDEFILQAVSRRSVASPALLCPSA